MKWTLGKQKYFMVLSFTSAIWLWTQPLYAEVIPGEFIVTFKEQRSLGFYNLQRDTQSQIKAVLRSGQAALVKRPSVELETFSVNSILRNGNDIESVEPNQVIRLSATNDVSFSKLWGISNSNPFSVRAEAAWLETTGNPNLVVAVVDTGIDYNHPDLQQNIFVNRAELGGKRGVDDDRNGYVDDLYGYDFSGEKPSPKSMDDNGHGTHVAGTIAAVGNNRQGVVGVAPSVKLLPIKFLSTFGSGSLFGAMQGIEYAIIRGAKVINNSWGGGAYSKALEDLIKRTEARGIVFVAAAGNSTNDNDKAPAYPASYEVGNVISVASIRSDGQLSSFSNFGRRSVHVAAPGQDIFSTMPGNKYDSLSGTSMATPHVSGVAALMISKNPNLSTAQVKQILTQTSVRNRNLRNKVVAQGQVNAEAALKRVPSR